MNRTTLTGRLTRDPQLGETGDGTPVCNLRLAVDGLGRGNETGYIDVAQFGAGGKAAADILTKGWLVAVDGRLAQHDWTPDGASRPVTQTSVIGQIEFLSAPRAAEDPEPAPEPAAA